MSPELIELYKMLIEKTKNDELSWIQVSPTAVSIKNDNNLVYLTYNYAPKTALALSASNVLTNGKPVDSINVEIISLKEVSDKFEQTIKEGREGYDVLKTLIVSAIASIERRAALKLKSFL